MVRTCQMYINGAWLDAVDGAVYDDYDPYTGEVFARVPAGTPADARRAVDAASHAFPQWSQTSPLDRQALFLRAADLLEQKQAEVVAALEEEGGATVGWAKYQAQWTPRLFREAAAQVHQATGEVVPADLPGAFYMTLRQPVGVVVGIAPWNAPLVLSLRAICLPLVYGNTVILKPSAESAVAGGVLLAEVFHAAGFPKGAVNLVTTGPGGSAAVGEVFLEDPRVRRISLTGSSAVGRELAAGAGRHLKRVVMELGGQNPMIVCRDADLDAAVNAAAFGGFLHSGQICMSTRRLIVEQPVAQAFTDKLVAKVSRFPVGNPKDPATVIGPLINKQQLDAVVASVEIAVRDGARILCGGKTDGLCYYPTVLTHVRRNSPFACEETFGPVVSIFEVATADEAIAVANETPYGLSASVFTQDLAKGLALAQRIESGKVHLNDQTVLNEPQMPIGGVKDSGWGRLGGRAMLEEFTELRWISMQLTPRKYPF